MDDPLPKHVQRLRERAAIIQIIDALPDGAYVSTHEASVYCGVHPKTLLRWRSGYSRKAYKGRSAGGQERIDVRPVGGAPLAAKHKSASSRATNQHLHWQVGDLKRFMRERATQDSFEAGALDYQSFAGQLEQLTVSRPWFASNGLIVDEATCAQAAVFDAWARRDGSVDLLSLSVGEAMCDYDWTSAEARAPWQEFFVEVTRAFADRAEQASAAKQSALALGASPERAPREGPRS